MEKIVNKKQAIQFLIDNIDGVENKSQLAKYFGKQHKKRVENCSVTTFSKSKSLNLPDMIIFEVMNMLQ